MRKKPNQKNPFKKSHSLNEVYITAGGGAYRNTRNVLSNIDLKVLKGKRVLLKPNAGRNAKPNSGITTHPQVVAAAIDTFRDAGAIVSIGESPITGVKAADAFEASGIAEVARKRNCPLIDMDAKKPTIVKIKGGKAISSLKLCTDVLLHDIIVSIPVMKMHMYTKVTLSVKNMKGCLYKRSKVDLHMLDAVKDSTEMPLDIAIADMASILRPHLSIIDGTVGMEGLGPSAGTAKKLDVVIAGFDPFAADSVGAALMGIRTLDVPHLRMGADRGYGTIDLSKIKVQPANWQELSSPFEPPPENLSIQFPGFTIMDEQSCSACQSTVLLLLKRHAQEISDYFPDEKDVSIAIGKGHVSVPGNTICIGNCTKEHKETGTFIPGCPPVISEILNKVSKK